jgi:hypothetical protein
MGLSATVSITHSKPQLSGWLRILDVPQKNKTVSRIKTTRNTFNSFYALLQFRPHASDKKCTPSDVLRLRHPTFWDAKIQYSAVSGAI